MQKKCLKLQANVRAIIGRSNNDMLRNCLKKIPAIIYSKDVSAIPISLFPNKIFSHVNINKIYRKKILIKMETCQYNVIVKYIHYHPYRLMILHIDFLLTNDWSNISSGILIKYIGIEENVAIKAGAIILKKMIYINIVCNINIIPLCIEIDLKLIKLDEIVYLHSLKLSKGLFLDLRIYGKIFSMPIVRIRMSRILKVEYENKSEINAKNEKICKK